MAGPFGMCAWAKGRAFACVRNLDLFLDRGANRVLVAPTRCRGNVEGQQNRKCQRHAGECCGDPAPWPISRTSTPDGNHDARSQGRLMRCLNPSEISRVGDAPR
jgi:hypothetical protein